jgi:hypothetical protein
LAAAVARLGAALSESTPYRAELDETRALAEGDGRLGAILASLDAYADSGAPTLADLTRSFDAVATEAARVKPVLDGDGWLVAVVNRIATLVSVRRVEDLDSAHPVDAALGRAERALRDGDLSAAIAALQTLKGASAEVAADWLSSARARAAVDAAKPRLTAALAKGE